MIETIETKVTMPVTPALVASMFWNMDNDQQADSQYDNQ